MIGHLRDGRGSLGLSSTYSEDRRAREMRREDGGGSD